MTSVLLQLPVTITGKITGFLIIVDIRYYQSDPRNCMSPSQGIKFVRLWHFSLILGSNYNVILCSI